MQEHNLYHTNVTFVLIVLLPAHQWTSGANLGKFMFSSYSLIGLRAGSKARIQETSSSTISQYISKNQHTAMIF